MSEKIKDQTICEACQLAVAAGGNIDDPLLAQHLQDCPECQQFAEFQKLVMATPLSVERELPEFSDLIQQMHQQKKRSRRFLRMMVWPLSMAAAAAVVIGGIALQLPQTQLPEYGTEPEYPLWEDSALFAAALDESSVMLAWDQTTYNENICHNSMQAARLGAELWSIEVFNPYNEDFLK